MTSNPELGIHLLEAFHEEGDTRIVLHCLHTDAESVVVWARDTDILILLLAHFHKMICTKLWMKVGTAKQRKYIPIHKVRDNLSLHSSVLETLIPFHAVTGCDSVSFFAGHGKKTAWKIFITDNHLLKNLGTGELTDNTIKDAEHFVCKVYGVPDMTSSDSARVKLFSKCKMPDALPPTSDALKFHIQRAHYQSMV